MAPETTLWIFALLLPRILGQIRKMEPQTLMDGNSTTVSYRDALYQRQSPKETFDSTDPRGLLKVFRESQRTGASRATIIAFFLFHDSAVAVSKNGKVQCVLELERLFGIRYFNSIGLSRTQFRNHWLQALRLVQERCECDDGGFPEYFHDAVIVQASQEHRAKRFMFPHIVEEVLKIGHWHIVGHKLAHAALAFYGSSFRSGLVFAYDAGSHLFYGRGMELKELTQVNWNFAHYKDFAIFMPEVSGLDEPNRHLCRTFADELKLPDVIEWVHPPTVHMSPELSLGLSGKLMGYAGTANATEKLTSAMLSYLDYASRFVSGRFEQLGVRRVPFDIIRAWCGPEEDHRVLAASIQAAWGKTVVDAIQEIIKSTNAAETMDGIALSGGCALNVVVNQELLERFESAEKKAGDSATLSLHVPVAPNDAGLTVGGLWAFEPPLRAQALQYRGFRLFDDRLLDSEAEARGAQRLSQLGGVNYVAELLAGGPAWTLSRNSTTKAKPIIAVVRGRQEFGPRALGHRSLLAVPDSVEMRERLNRVKSRKWYRPVAPMIAEEALEQVFGKRVHSTYMSMAPKVKDAVRAKFPAMVHFDGTARHQSVSKSDEPWVHALLHAVGSWTGLAALINTSFNSKGYPIVNTVTECLKMLDELPDLDYVVIEDRLFKPPMIKKTPEPKELFRRGTCLL